MCVGELELEYPYRQFQSAREVFELLSRKASERFTIQLRPAKLLVRLEAETIDELTALGKQKQEAFDCLFRMAFNFEIEPKQNWEWCEAECLKIWNGEAPPIDREWVELDCLDCKICRALCLQGVLSIEEINAYHWDELELQGFPKEVQDLVQNIFHR
jgi:hypothetical protein